MTNLRHVCSVITALAHGANKSFYGYFAGLEGGRRGGGGVDMHDFGTGSSLGQLLY